VSHFHDVYRAGGAAYDALVRREDAPGNIERNLHDVCSLTGRDAVEFGAGTGRVSALLAPHVHSLVVTDASAHMLSFAARRLHGSPASWSAAVADARQSPFTSACADVAVAGWCYGHATEWHTADWQTHIDRAVNEMLRVLRPGGTAVIFETMGTGVESPAPPYELLAAYYDRLETHFGFTARTFPTDYVFASVDEADHLVRGFFGDALADQLRDANTTRLPEYTGMWWRTA